MTVSTRSRKRRASDTPPATIPIDPPSDAINDLAAHWIASLPDEATVFSPVGVWPVLAILADAATDEVAAELRSALCLEPSDDISLIEAALSVLEFLDRSKLFDAAVAVWVSKALAVKQAWLARLPEQSRGLLTQTSADKAILDEWAQERTRNLFQTFPAEITPADDLVLASAVALNMQWMSKFYRTDDGLLCQDFRGLNYIRTAEDVTVVRIRGRERNEYGNDHGSSRWYKPSVPPVDCYLVLGTEGAPASEVLSRGLRLVRQYGDRSMSYSKAMALAGPGLTRRLEESHKRPDKGQPYVQVVTPGFKVSGDHDLLKNDVFGLKSAATLTEEAAHHFPGITDYPLCVGAAKQSAVARFHKKGFSAAAITIPVLSGATRRKPPPPSRALFLDVKIDRPFGFLCVEQSTKIVTFAGWVTEDQFMKSDDDLIYEGGDSDSDSE